MNYNQRKWDLSIYSIESYPQSIFPKITGNKINGILFKKLYEISRMFVFGNFDLESLILDFFIQKRKVF